MIRHIAKLLLLLTILLSAGCWMEVGPGYYGDPYYYNYCVATYDYGPYGRVNVQYHPAIDYYIGPNYVGVYTIGGGYFTWYGGWQIELIDYCW